MHVDRTLVSLEIEEYEDRNDDLDHLNQDMDKWQILSHIIHPNALQTTYIDTLGRRDFDLNDVWDQSIDSTLLAKDAKNFV